MRAHLANGCLLSKHNRHGPTKTVMSCLLWKTDRGPGLVIHSCPVYNTSLLPGVQDLDVADSQIGGMAIRQDTT